jgi:hypothetical protein
VQKINFFPMTFCGARLSVTINVAVHHLIYLDFPTRIIMISFQKKLSDFGNAQAKENVAILGVLSAQTLKSVAAITELHAQTAETAAVTISAGLELAGATSMDDVIAHVQAQMVPQYDHAGRYIMCLFDLAQGNSAMLLGLAGRQLRQAGERVIVMADDLVDTLPVMNQTVKTP